MVSVPDFMTSSYLKTQASFKLTFCPELVLVAGRIFCAAVSISASEPELDLPVPGDRLGSVEGEKEDVICSDLTPRVWLCHYPQASTIRTLDKAICSDLTLPLQIDT